MNAYRKDIDGLRSVAVMLVVLYHFGFKTISGGFVGVDVFFVISGFLITSIISKQVIDNNFSFKTFYLRRIKRLMPALLMMVLLSLLAFSHILVPSDYARLSMSIIYVSAYIANIFFWKEYGGYFAGDTQEAPLLHTWSLAVEEQFYVIWPVFIILSYKLIGLKKSIVLTALATIAMVYVSQLGTQLTVGAAYYLLPTRAFELMLGALLAMSWSSIPTPKQKVSDVLSLVGISLILYSAFTLTKADTFPGYNALFPTLGSCLLLLSGKGAKGIINRILENKVAVFIGLISYSLYLYHWPIIVFVEYMAFELNSLSRAILVLFAILVGYLSYRFVEQPIRKANIKASNATLTYYVYPSMLLVLISSTVIFNNGFSHRFEPHVAIMDEAINTHSNEVRARCHASLQGALEKPDPECVLGRTDASKTGFMFGDSHANHYTGFMDVIAKEAEVKVHDNTLDQCPPIFGLSWGKSPYKAKLCKKRNELNKQYIEQSKPDFVVIAASWPNQRSTMVFDESSKEFKTGKVAVQILSTKIKQTIEFFDANSIPLVIITDTPYILDNKPNCPIKKELFVPEKDCSIKDSRNTWLSDELSSLSKEYRFSIIEPRNLICKDGKCALSLNGVPLYRDVDHLNDMGSRELGKAWIEQGHILSAGI